MDTDIIKLTAQFVARNGWMLVGMQWLAGFGCYELCGNVEGGVSREGLVLQVRSF